MYCIKCGSDVQSESASNCSNCNEPLPQIADDVRIDRDCESAKINFDESSTDLKINNPEHEQLDMANPIDFLMEQDDFNPGEKADTERVQNKVDFLNTGLNDTTAESEKSEDLEFNIADSLSGFGYNDETPANKPELSKPSADKIENSQFAGSGIFDFNSGANITATQKIKTDNFATDLKIPEVEIQKPSSPPEPTKKFAPIRQSKGLIYYDGQALYPSRGTEIYTGDEITIGEKTFEVRLKANSRFKLYAGIAAAAIIVFIGIFYFFSAMPSGNGQLVGMINKSAIQDISKYKIKIRENGNTAKANAAGFFVFEDLPPGLYTVDLMDGDVSVSEAKITILGKTVSTLMLNDDNFGPVSNSNTQKPSMTAAVSSIASAKKKDEVKLGGVKITVSPSDAIAYLDSKPLGKGSKTYSTVKPGKYRLSLKKAGYNTESVKIDVVPGKTKSYNFSLKKTAQKGSDGELAFQNETAGNYTEALKYYDKILEKDPNDIKSLMGKARCYRALNNTEKSATCYIQASKIAEANGDKASQIDALSGIIELKPKTFTAYFSRGDLLYSLGQYKRAAKDYEKVVSLDQRNLKAYYLLGRSYYLDKNYTDAITAFRAAEELNFADYKAQVNLAKTYAAMGDYKNAKKNYEKYKDLAGYSTAIELKNDKEWQDVLNKLGVND